MNWAELVTGKSWSGIIFVDINWTQLNCIEHTELFHVYLTILTEVLPLPLKNTLMVCLVCLNWVIHYSNKHFFFMLIHLKVAEMKHRRRLMSCRSVCTDMHYPSHKHTGPSRVLVELAAARRGLLNNKPMSEHLHLHLFYPHPTPTTAPSPLTPSEWQSSSRVI